MKEFQDFVYAENAKTVGRENFTKTIKGLFVGTKNYFFFFPEKAEETEHGYTKTTYITTTYTYEGKHLPEYVMGALKEVQTAREFESLVMDQLKDEIGDWMRIFPMEEITEFKVQAGFFGSGVAARFANKKYTGLQKYSATPIAISLGKKKKQIKEFYNTHPKYVEK